ncbi:MAG: glycerol-3-phosphate 1-O-acyltransferase PlsY [Dehalococcoidales bacterium]|nr:glycerol-3-phosphate 1-O-acyltransferase PlsY [Dehalococcoidales bacterium]
MIGAMIARYLAAMICGYLLGSIPWGLIVGKKMAKVDVRELGSGKTGATNVLRSAGKKVAIVTALLDILKGAAAVILAGFILEKSYVMVGSLGFGALFGQVLAGLAAVAGHNWPLFLGFRGGRGVAVFFGGWFALLPMVALFGGEVMVLGAASTLFVSLGSIAGVVGTYVILVPLTIFSGFPVEYLIYALGGTGIIIYTHRDNIKRLLTGKERKLGQKAEKVQTETGTAQ